MLKEINQTEILTEIFPIKIFLLVCVIGVTIVIVIEHVNIFRNKYKMNCMSKPGYCIHNFIDKDALKYVQYVLKKVGYEKKAIRSQCDLLWSFKSPFNASHNPKFQLLPHQTANHFPGMNFITDEVLFANTVSDFIPKTFILPKDKQLFVNYASNNPESLFLIKEINRSRLLKKWSDIDLNKVDGRRFIQEYIQQPFLVDGYKVDIGVFVVVTSMDPLRAYWYKGDVLIRFSKDEYSMENQTIIRKDYLYMWDMPSLQKYYKDINGMKNAFDVYVFTSGKETTAMWENVQQAISEILLDKEPHIVEAMKSYGSKGNFFEILRFDLTINQNLEVYLLGANTLDSMSPNKDSMHQDEIALFYEQLLYNTFALTGISRGMIFRRNGFKSDSTGVREMIASTKQIVLFANECRAYCKDSCEELFVCQLCRLCMRSKLRDTLLKAYAEYIHRGEFRRLVPPPMLELSEEDDNNIFNMEEYIPKHLSLMNRLQYLWYQGKCNQDITWCA